MLKSFLDLGSAKQLRTTFDHQPNGLNAARHLFASVVVWSHSFEVGGYGVDPLKKLTGLTSGDLAVAYFFAVSGFLIARSWIRKPVWHLYLWHRFLRILPAFWICLLISAFILYPLWLLSSGVADLGHANWPEAGRYVLTNASLRIRQAGIGDMFSGNPANGVINGSLWSLFPEFLCYLFVLGLGVLDLFRPRMVLAHIAVFAILALGMSLSPCLLLRVAGTDLYPPLFYIGKLVYVGAFFCGGILLAVFAHRIRVSWLLWLGCLLVFGVGLFSPFLFAKALLPIAAPYLAIAGSCLIPFNRCDHFGDFSYGIYIYHFPLQQVMVTSGWAYRVPVGVFFLCSWIFAMLLGCLSWYFIEKPSMSHRNYFAR
jgi:peptidoglycan/LPS O-acetylase OafA/YrhL